MKVFENDFIRITFWIVEGFRKSSKITNQMLENLMNDIAW